MNRWIPTHIWREPVIAPPLLREEGSGDISLTRNLKLVNVFVYTASPTGPLQTMTQTQLRASYRPLTLSETTLIKDIYDETEANALAEALAMISVAVVDPTRKAIPE